MAQQQVRKSTRGQDEEVIELPKGEKADLTDLDDLLDEIDEVLEKETIDEVADARRAYRDKLKSINFIGSHSDEELDLELVLSEVLVGIGSADVLLGCDGSGACSLCTQSC